MTWEWLAGFYEGEGSCYYQRSNGRRRYFRIYIVQKDRAPLDAIQNFTQCGVVFKRKQRPSPNHAYSLYGFRAVHLAERLLPHMQCRKKIQQLRRCLAAFRDDPDKQQREYRKN